MGKKVKKWEPETAKGFCWPGSDEKLSAYVKDHKTTYFHTPVRIIREGDYQRLLKLARKAKERVDE